MIAFFFSIVLGFCNEIIIEPHDDVQKAISLELNKTNLVGFF
jgi:hypothetical protein